MLIKLMLNKYIDVKEINIINVSRANIITNPLNFFIFFVVPIVN